MIPKFHLSEAVCSSSFIIPELTDESMFLYVSKLEVVDSLIYILDANKVKAVFVYDMKGRFLRKIGRLGQGPGEYLQISFGKPHIFLKFLIFTFASFSFFSEKLVKHSETI